MNKRIYKQKYDKLKSAPKAKASQVSEAKKTTSKSTKESTTKKSNKKIITLRQGSRDILIDFLEGHLPERYKVDTDAIIVDAKGNEVKSDIIVYHPFCPKMHDMTGNVYLAEFIHSSVMFEPKLTEKSLKAAIDKTKSVKMLNLILPSMPSEVPQSLVGVTFAFESELPLEKLKQTIIDYNKEKYISNGLEMDFFVVMDKGMVIFDSENPIRKYAAIETKEDTLMWFYILLMEYMDANAVRAYSLRDYIRKLERYPEY